MRSDTTRVNSDEHELAALTRRMTELGASEPGSWAGSDTGEGIPQQARLHITSSKRWQLNARLPPIGRGTFLLSGAFRGRSFCTGLYAYPMAGMTPSSARSTNSRVPRSNWSLRFSKRCD